MDRKEKIRKLELFYTQWLQINQDLDFYFEKMFELSLEILRSRPDNADTKDKKALFLPVGYSLEHVALMSAFFNPQFLTLAVSDSVRHFFRKHQDKIEQNIKKYCRNTKLNHEYDIISTNQKSTEEAVKKWLEMMHKGYGLEKKELAVDITGGTKPIAVGVQNAAFHLDIDAFYLDIEYDEIYRVPVPGTERVCKMSLDTPLLDKKLVFVSMPFGTQWDECQQKNVDFDRLYEHSIRPAIETQGLNPGRIDRKHFSGLITKKIMENIEKARFVVAVLSSPNPNVYHEVGYAQGLRKKVILLTGCTEAVAFNLRPYRMILYKDTEELKQKLVEEISSLLRELQKQEKHYISGNWGG